MKTTTVIATLTLVLLARCASPRPLFDPELDDPERIIRATSDSPFRDRAKRDIGSDGKEWLELPEVVRVIGFTGEEDGRRAKVLRAGEFDPAKWQPWPEAKLQTHGCGPEFESISAMQAQPEAKP